MHYFSRNGMNNEKKKDIERMNNGTGLAKKKHSLQHSGIGLLLARMAGIHVCTPGLFFFHPGFCVYMCECACAIRCR